MTGQRHAVLLCPHYADVLEREQEPARVRDGRGFEVRSSRFSERRTLNFELRIAPFSLVSRVPPVSRGYPAGAVRLTSR